MLPKPLSAIIILCEKVMQEKDDLVSTIRIADLFYVPLLPDVPIEKHAVLMQVLVMCKFRHDDESTHSIGLRLTRPDGTQKDVAFWEPTGHPLEFSLAELIPKVPEAPRGLNLIAPWGVKATHMGLHRLDLLIDGEDSASVFFTLARPLAENRTIA
jgi:hypothetical protein